MTKYTEKKFSDQAVKHVLDDEEAIYTRPLPNGMFLAVRGSDGKSEGIGKTRIDAVVDLIENLSGFDARFLYDIDALRSVAT